MGGGIRTREIAGIADPRKVRDDGETQLVILFHDLSDLLCQLSAVFREVSVADSRVVWRRDGQHDHRVLITADFNQAADIEHTRVLQGKRTALDLSDELIRLCLLPCREVGTMRGRKCFQFRQKQDTRHSF